MFDAFVSLNWLFNYFHFPFNILWLCFTIRFVLASAHGFKIKGLKWKKNKTNAQNTVDPPNLCVQQFTVSSKILCPLLLLIYTCSTFPCQHVVVISCFVWRSPLFIFFLSFFWIFKHGYISIYRYFAVFSYDLAIWEFSISL